jgi:hypothetical protein
MNLVELRVFGVTRSESCNCIFSELIGSTFQMARPVF